MRATVLTAVRIVSLSAVLLLVGHLDANTAIESSPRTDYTPEKLAAWMKRHDEFVSLARKGGIEVLFLGDSITDRFRTLGKSVWDEHYAPLHAANFGISGDRTQHLLWRLENGEIAGLSPKVVVLMIGTNNIDPRLGEKDLVPRNTSTDIIGGIAKIVQTLQKNLPGTKILLLGIFPRGEKDGPIRQQINEINAGLHQLDREPLIRFLDIGSKFLTPDGTLSRAIMPDLVHPSEEGYKIWATAIKGSLSELMSSMP